MTQVNSAEDRIVSRLAFLYGEAQAGALAAEVDRLVERHRPALARWRDTPRGWDQRDALLITYANTILEQGVTPLAALRRFLREHVGDRVSLVHLLPFYPWTSDDGFSVVDYREVDSAVGDWPDVEALADDHRLVFDAVINHVSQVSAYVQGYLADDPRYRDFCIELSPDTDTSSVLRTRNLPLLHDYDSPSGKRWLWTTFSRDQVDLNYGNPRVLMEMLDVLLGYAGHGASVLRLDAVPYLWKQLGTSCAHLPQTHEIIRLIRDVFDVAAPWVLLLTETNNPHHENVSYFGRPGHEGEEAQIIYNFTLAPLIVHAFFRGNTRVLTDWARGVHHVGDRATYLNITATHDGIGMRPTEGILPEDERAALVQLSIDRGGDMTGKRNSDGSVSPYELNITYFDAINDPRADEPMATQVDRFLAAQAIALSFIGIPGLYIHSLLGSRNDHEGVKRTGRARSINRAQLDRATLDRELGDAGSLRQQVLTRYRRLLEIRRTTSAFDPRADQTVLDVGPAVFALRREHASTGETVVALHNVTGQPVAVSLDAVGLTRCRDLISGERNVADLGPYQVRWLRAE